MTDVIQGDGARIGAAFADNRLLATFPADLRAALRDQAKLVDLEPGAMVFRRGIDIEHSLFPLGPTMISLIVDMADGRSVEVASIGSEGAVGGIVSCGHAPAFARAEAMIGGAALRVPMRIIEQAKARSGHLRNMFCRYADFLLAQVMQTVACNSFHPIEARAARWLLTACDRAGNRLELTQGGLAALLGVQRTTVNAVAKELQDEGLISTRRGVINVLDRPALERRACECYARVEGFFGDIVGESGLGRSE
ncbi:MAG: Crp/Fnr family transcriptional regulator [Sphingomonas sp.]|uniref:Crp/Fnr family transcriptional regulator n=1 Tax=Sphingomonas sp. TaxID=28214 RepID=UPI00185EADA5|nr:Crp/Fnr family transcriptional regulator [Sphingomonas sp.]MBA3668081.1 Crp/Fnr family transcriptional regulator [Sphingomonas sp.]